MKVKIWDIIKLKEYASSPKYTYLVLDIDIEAEFEAWNIWKEEWYIKLQNLTRLIEWWNEESIISNKSVKEIEFNIKQ